MIRDLVGGEQPNSLRLSDRRRGADESDRPRLHGRCPPHHQLDRLPRDSPLALSEARSSTFLPGPAIMFDRLGRSRMGALAPLPSLASLCALIWSGMAFVRRVSRRATPLLQGLRRPRGDQCCPRCGSSAWIFDETRQFLLGSGRAPISIATRWRCSSCRSVGWHITASGTALLVLEDLDTVAP